jgi:hypothetical protein
MRLNTDALGAAPVYTKDTQWGWDPVRKLSIDNYKGLYYSNELKRYLNKPGEPKPVWAGDNGWQPAPVTVKEVGFSPVLVTQAVTKLKANPLMLAGLAVGGYFLYDAFFGKKGKKSWF